jgi:hypothetical protein
MIFVLVLARGKRVLKFLSVQNFCPASVEKLGKLLNKPKLKINFRSCTEEELNAYCKRDTEIVVDFIKRWCEYLEQNDAGKFSYTRASQSFTVFRHRFMTENIEVHTHDEAERIEHGAYFGGLNECYRIGNFQGIDMILLDVNSMYPFVMKEKEYPCKLLDITSSPSLSKVSAYIDDYCFTAEAVVNTDKPVYAVREKQKVLFPIGEFKTFVSSAALKYGLKCGHIKDIMKLCVYKKARPFTSFVNHFYALKEKHKRDGDEVWSEIDKLILNSLYGKFGQQVDCCIEKEKTDTVDFSRDSVYDMDTKQHLIIQNMFGIREVFCGKQSSENTFFAIPAHVTEYARFYLFSLFDIIGRDNIYYADTDGFFIELKHLKKYVKHIDKFKLGALDVKARGNDLIIRGCKDYHFNNTVKLKGIRKDAVQISDNEYEQNLFPSFNRILHEKSIDMFPIYTVRKVLTRKYEKGTVTASGFVEPLRFQSLYPLPAQSL